MTQWFEDPDFWMAHYPRMFTPQRMESAEGDIACIEKLAALSPPAQVLDLCCGPGRHSVALARRGYAVTGLDLTPEYLTLAEELAHSAGVMPEFIQGDMRDYCLPAGFDLAINLFTSFGYFEAREEDHQVLANVHASLKAGGIFVMDMMGKEILARRFQERDWMEENGVLLLEERRICRDWSWVINRLTVIEAGKQKAFEISHRLYSAVELKSALYQAGFKTVTVYGDLQGAPYDHTAERLVAVAGR
jgi:SAM-dependent methyltransferase